MDDIVDMLFEKCKDVDNRDVLIFKILMQIHDSHEIIKCGLASENPLAQKLLEYYRNLAGVCSPMTMKLDTVFYDCRDVPFVYSIELDRTIPLISYPYEIFEKNVGRLKNVTSGDATILKKILNFRRRPENVKEFFDACRLFAKLTPGCQSQLEIENFFN